MQGVPAWCVHLLCLALVGGRLIHAFGVSQQRENIRLRVAGMTITFAVLAAMALTLLVARIY
jgi:uncharacterized membrane protein YecN with MAPEG domain